MIQAEGEIESRIAIPGALRVQQNRTLRANQNVLRTDIPMHQCVFRTRRGFDQPMQRWSEIGMANGRGFQIRLQAQAMENRIRGKLRSDPRTVRRSSMYQREEPPELRGERGIGPAAAQFDFP